jgi:arsenate reductase
MSKVTIYHNPRCSKSRQTLALLEEQGIEPTIIEYLKNPPSEKTLKHILKMLNKTPRELMRHGEGIYKELGLDDAKLTEKQLIEAMVEHPILIERPIVVVDDKAKIGRPPEVVLEILSE